MKHTVDELLQVVYQHYWCSTSYDVSGPYGPRDRLVEARKEAGKPNTPWREFLARLYVRFPDRVTNCSLHLPAGDFDACYRVTLKQCSSAAGDSALHSIGMAISFIAPYYVVYSSRNVDHIKHKFDEVQRFHPFDLLDDELADAEAMVDELKRLFPNHMEMPGEIGNIVVPDVLVGNQLLGKGTIYHCFFTDSW